MAMRARSERARYALGRPTRQFCGYKSAAETHVQFCMVHALPSKEQVHVTRGWLPLDIGLSH